VSRGTALLFSRIFGTRWGVGVSPTPRPPVLPGKTRYPLYRRLGGPRGRSGRVEKLIPTGIRSRTVHPVAQSLFRLSFPAHTHTHTHTHIYIYIYIYMRVEYSCTSSISTDWYVWAHSLNLFIRHIFNPCANEFYVHANLGWRGNTTRLDDSQVTKECFCI